MNDFFAGFEKNRPEPPAKPAIKKYPLWVEQSKKPEQERLRYDAVMTLFDQCEAKIKAREFKKLSEVLLSQASVCRELGRVRSALKNHEKIGDLILAQNKILEGLIAAIKIKGEKSTARKTKGMIKTELDQLTVKSDARTKQELEILLNSALIISQSDALNEIANKKAELAKVREELAQVKLANTTLQAEKADLERRLFQRDKLKIQT